MNTWRTRVMSITVALGCLAATTVLAQDTQMQRTPPRMEQKKAPAPVASFPRIAVATETLNVRSAPSTTAQIIGRLATGQEISVLGMTSGFARIGEGQFVSGAKLKFK